MMNEDLEEGPETIKAEIEEMIKNHPQIVIECVTENMNFFVTRLDKKVIQKLKNMLTDWGF